MYKHSLLTCILYYLFINANVYATPYLMEKITSNDTFGTRVGISSEYCVIGATDDSSGYSNGGAVYVYKYDLINNNWNYTQTLHPNDITTNANCGIDVSIFNKSIIIGCHGIDKAYIYKYNETNETWYQLSTLTAVGGSGSDLFGRTVDITDGYAIVGDYLNDDEATNAGSSYIFVQTFDQFGHETWIYNQTLYAGDAAQDDRFGRAVSISYHFAIVSGIRDDDKGTDSGSAYIFELNENTMIWEQATKLTASDGATGDYLGISVSIDGIYGFAIVGTIAKGDGIGACYIYQRNDASGIWNQAVKLKPNDETSNQRFGWSVNIDGETCVVGAYETNSYSGSAYLYKFTSTWTQVSYLTAFDAGSDDRFGHSVDVFGDFIVIAANAKKAVYIYGGVEPSFSPTTSPTTAPTTPPSTFPTVAPLSTPTSSPSLAPSSKPTAAPSVAPSSTPTSSPTTSSPSLVPSSSPSLPPSSTPSSTPSLAPSSSPTTAPSVAPSSTPSLAPSSTPTTAPSLTPSSTPSLAPSSTPTTAPNLAPSSTPTSTPTLSPSLAPSSTPTDSPSTSPTNTYCDKGVQTRDTFIVCKLLLTFDSISDDLLNMLSSPNYCYDNDYFQCDNSNSTITHIFFNNNNINGLFDINTTYYLQQIINNGSLIWLDLSNNQITDQITYWSVFAPLQYLSLANNKIDGLIDFEQLRGHSGSNLYFIDLSNNYFDPQSISWQSFQFIPNLEHFDISSNSFAGNIEISYFQYCNNLKYFNVAFNLFASFDDFDESISETYMPQLEEFIFNNNEIDEQFDMTYFSTNNKLKTIKCNNNSLINSKLDMNNIPSSLETFICGNNDFGEFIWNPSPYDEYNLKHIDLTNARIYGQITMNFFDNDDGGYKQLQYVDLSYNENLNITINFIHLDGQAYLYYLNLIKTDAYGRVDFDYLSDSIADNITIKLEDDIYCVDSYCNGNNGKNYGYTRDNEECNSKENCLESCDCETAFTVGLEKFIPSQGRQISFVVLIVVVCSLFMVVLLGKGHAIGLDSKLGVSIGYESDYFQFIGVVAFIFQIWDFFSDSLLCFDIFDHYNQASIDNPKKKDYLRYLVSCAIFIFIPWIINLLFLIKTKRGWEKQNNLSKNNINISEQQVDALAKSSAKTSEWLNKYSTILVLLCMVSGGLTASLKVVNSNLFGLKQFNMGLPKYKQDETARHRLWLTIILENIPQIIISTSYATNLARFDTAVLAALISSIASVVLALLSAYLEYPKKYNIHQMDIQLKSKQNPNLTKHLKMRNKLSKVICKSLDREKGLLFIENIHYNDDFLCFNVVSNERITFDVGKTRKLIQLFENNKLRIKCNKISFKFVYEKSVKLSFVKCKNIKSLKLFNGANTKDVELVMAGSQVSDAKSASVTARGSVSMAGIIYDGSSGQSGMTVQTAHNVVNNEDWHLWTAKQVSAWVEMELRKGFGARDLRRSDVFGDDEDTDVKTKENDVPDEIEFVDEDMDVSADKFMKKFKSLTLNGPLLLKMKTNDEMRNAIKTEMMNQSVGFWFIVSEAIDSLKLPNIDNNDRY